MREYHALDSTGDNDVGPRTFSDDWIKNEAPPYRLILVRRMP
jgi:hypothetical protein